MTRLRALVHAGFLRGIRLPACCTLDLSSGKRRMSRIRALQLETRLKVAGGAVRAGASLSWSRQIANFDLEPGQAELSTETR